VIRVMVVDDSAVLRQSLKFILESDPELKVIGEAKNGEEAIALAGRLQPNVITMDIRMPKMDGLDAIRHIMAESPAPIVVVTSIDLDQEANIPSQATKLGAVSILRRPLKITSPEYQAFSTKLIEQVKLMSDVKVITRSWAEKPAPPASRAQGVITTPMIRPEVARKIEIVAIGASTGGPAALHQILGALPADFPMPILVVQHISFGFVEGLSGWLDMACKLHVKVAEQGERIQPGVVYVAPDEHHMEVGYGRIRLSQSEPVDGHRPSATVLFKSAARAYGSAALSVILTGMGADGAAGMKALSEAGAITIAQDEESCVVFGMPKEAIALGAVEHVVTLEQMAKTIIKLIGMA
jgi:two-component system chemotaxis response regulator CheB